MEGWAQYIGFLAAVLTTFAGVPQMVRIVRLKESRDVSLWMTLMLAAGVSFDSFTVSLSGMSP
jgi:uncharacterized protein with PQ loop repeat